jgi:hypothetical protein
LQPANFWGRYKKREGEQSVLVVTHHQNTGQNQKFLKKYNKILTFWNNKNKSKLNSG